MMNNSKLTLFMLLACISFSTTGILGVNDQPGVPEYQNTVLKRPVVVREKNDSVPNEKSAKKKFKLPWAALTEAAAFAASGVLYNNKLSEKLGVSDSTLRSYDKTLFTLLAYSGISLLERALGFVAPTAKACVDFEKTRSEKRGALAYKKGFTNRLKMLGFELSCMARDFKRNFVVGMAAYGACDYAEKVPYVGKCLSVSLKSSQSRVASVVGSMVVSCAVGRCYAAYQRRSAEKE